MTSVYDAMAVIEKRRCDEDVLRRLILDVTERDKLKVLCRTFVTRLRTTYKNPSARLNQIWTTICETDDRVALHGFLFFCLRKHKWAIEEVLKNAGAPPEKISSFVLNILPDLSNKLLRGTFTSLRSYVEDARWQYLMI
jgi:hypothetical protein